MTPTIADPAAQTKQSLGQTGHAIPATVRPTPTADHLLHAPLDQLLREQRVSRVIDSSITDEYFCGAALLDGDGALVLHLPVGRDPGERDEAVRKLIAAVHHLSEDAFPGPIATTDVTKHVEGVL
ncbi:hypothetical protein ABZ957_03310 [Streptomyces sp. NPDC046316]|uniref:hypothetical protein n=1 Tax=Streptomyces sp. NPDC046316 TaxID=3154494 RepID=UPI0033C63928